jgi:hypothetical protein
MIAVLGDDSDTSVRAVTLSLTLLRAMSSIIPLDHLVDAKHNFLPALGVALSLSPVQVECSACLQALCSHKMSGDDTARLYAQYIAEYLVITHLPEDIDDRYRLIRNYVSMLSVFLASNAAKVWGVVATVYIDKLLKYTIQALQAPGRRAAGSVVMDWTKVPHWAVWILLTMCDVACRCSRMNLSSDMKMRPSLLKHYLMVPPCSTYLSSPSPLSLCCSLLCQVHQAC